MLGEDTDHLFIGGNILNIEFMMKPLVSDKMEVYFYMFEPGMEN